MPDTASASLLATERPRRTSARDSKLIGALVAAFEAESEAFAASQRQLLVEVGDQQPAVELGPEPGGVRYAFPELGFSAVFHQPPNATLSTVTATDGVTVTVRTLGIRDAIGYSTTIVCMSRPTPFTSADGRSFARQAIEKFGSSDVHDVDVGDRRGFAGSLSSAQVQTVDVRGGGCTILVEYPAPLAANYEDRGRAFLRSVDLSGLD